MRRGPKPKTNDERFWNFVDKTDTCWNWTGGQSAGGYGSFSEYLGDGKRITRRAHRFIMTTIHGDLGDKYVCHHCDNRICVRPDHLFIGTQSDNIKDMHAKGRNPKHWTQTHPERVQKGTGHHQAVLTEEDVLEIRRRAETELQVDIVKDYPVTKQTISDIVRRRRWSHL